MDEFAKSSRDLPRIHPQGGFPRAINIWLFGFLWLLACLAIFHRPLISLTHLVKTNDNASHILLIPVIFVWLIYLDRNKLPLSLSLNVSVPLLLLTLAALISAFSLWNHRLSFSDQLTCFTLSLVLCLQSGFIAAVGSNAARQFWFALAFLFLAVPLPDAVLDSFIFVLQSASADLAGLLFDWTGVPALRNGFIFHLPHLSIEVAKECSGIRSSIALLVLAILISHFSFRAFWKKALFISAGLVMMVVKNGVRIATLTILANYVNPAFLFGRLHHDGGILFFLLGLGLMLPVYWLLRRGEKPLGSGSKMAEGTA